MKTLLKVITSTHWDKDGNDRQRAGGVLNEAGNGNSIKVVAIN